MRAMDIVEQYTEKRFLDEVSEGLETIEEISWSIGTLASILSVDIDDEPDSRLKELIGNGAVRPNISRAIEHLADQADTTNKYLRDFVNVRKHLIKDV